MKKVASNAQQVLLDELNEFYISLTGEGISRHYKELLLEGGIEVIQAMIDEQKVMIAEGLSPEAQNLSDQDEYGYADMDQFIRDMDNFESDRCDSIDYCEHEGFTGKY